MSGALFGTDGVRGIPGQGALKPDAVRALAFHGARVLLERQGVKINGHAPLIAVGRDTRGSGPALLRSLIAGFSAAGVRVVDLGVLDRKSTRLNSSHIQKSRMPSSA